MPRKLFSRNELEKLSRKLDEIEAGTESVFYSDIMNAYAKDSEALYEQMDAVRRKLIFKLGKQVSYERQNPN